VNKSTIGDTGQASLRYIRAADARTCYKPIHIEAVDSRSHGRMHGLFAYTVEKACVVYTCKFASFFSYSGCDAD